MKPSVCVCVLWIGVGERERGMSCLSGEQEKEELNSPPTLKEEMKHGDRAMMSHTANRKCYVARDCLKPVSCPTPSTPTALFCCWYSEARHSFTLSLSISGALAFDLHAFLGPNSQNTQSPMCLSQSDFPPKPCPLT